jgi:hypothetical protein
VSKYNINFEIERVRKERDDWKECCERLVYSAPFKFCDDINWIKAVLQVKKIVERNKKSIVEQ